MVFRKEAVRRKRLHFTSKGAIQMPKSKSYGGWTYKCKPRNDASGRRCDELPDLTNLFPEGTEFSLTGIKKRDRSSELNGHDGLANRMKKEREAAVARLLGGQTTGEETPKE
jgi:hypothetical protein